MFATKYGIPNMSKFDIPIYCQFQKALTQHQKMSMYCKKPASIKNYLEQPERLHTENTPTIPWLSILSIYIRSHALKEILTYLDIQRPEHDAPSH